MCRSRCALTLLLALLTLSASAEWLAFGPGSPENSSPRTFHDITLDDRVCFDVELSGLLADTVLHESIPYLRLHHSPGTTPLDSVGFPELPAVVCFVAVPDDADLDLSYSANCPETLALTLPVYPAPLDSLVADSTNTPCYQEFFRQDSAAYTSEDWYPEELAEIVGEFHLRDQRVAVVAVHPVQYLASEDSLRVWGDLEMSVLLDGEAMDWNEDGLGYYDLLVGDLLLGYHPDYTSIENASPDVERHEDPGEPPTMDPDYVILVADGLDGEWIDDFAEYRADLNGFDVLIANLDLVYSAYQGSEPWPTDEMIRSYVEAVWDWTTPGTRPTYLLLIGDHDVAGCTSYPDWYLPTHMFTQPGTTTQRANDSWYSYIGEQQEIDVSVPDLITGRISARSSDEVEAMLACVQDYETPVQYPGPSSRRQLVRLAGRESAGGADGWHPTDTWVATLGDWLDYDYENHYCGDGDPSTSEDGSTLSSRQWIDACTGAFEAGSQVLLYTDHGSVHYFECGLNEGNPGDWLGQSDSTFDDLDIRDLSPAGNDFCPPFVILSSCSQNTFNWTDWQQYHDWPHWNNFNDEQGSPEYDFGVDCFAEELMKNTECGAISAFGASWASGFRHDNTIYSILDNLLCFGRTRPGDAIQMARLWNLDDYIETDGSFQYELGSFNLLGDPAVDIGDRVKFPSCCDIVISPADLEINRYPTVDISGHGDVRLYVTVRNAGGSEAGAFDVDLEITDDAAHQPDTLTRRCAGLAAGEERTFEYTWTNGWFDPPGTLILMASADDPGGQHPDSWLGNNDATVTLEVKDFYPNDSGWPSQTLGSITAPPMLVNLDHDEDLEIVVVSDQFLLAYDPDDSSEPIWTSGPFFLPSSSGIIPVAGDLNGDGDIEICMDTQLELLVLDGTDGHEIDAISSHNENRTLLRPHTVTLADVFHARPGLEIAVVFQDDAQTGLPPELYIHTLDHGSLVELDHEALPESDSNNYSPDWISACNLTVDTSTELAVAYSWHDATGYHSGLWVYDHDETSGDSEFIDSEIWYEDEHIEGIPTVGTLPSVGLAVSLSRRVNNDDEHHLMHPAWLLDPDDLPHPEECAVSETPSNQVLCCVMADWVSPSGVADRILANAENQCFAWKNDGFSDEDYPIDYEGYSGSARPPFPALGNLDDDGVADFLVATREGSILAYDEGGDQLGDLGFPYLLPSFVYGGFAIADIDNDGYVEVVFGTMDNYLHVWQLGECEEGYAPWPQCQHDAARTGVLLEE